MPQPLLDGDRRRGRGPRPAPARLRAAAIGALIALLAAVAAGCGSGGDGAGTATGASRVRFESCGETVELERPAQRVVILGDGLADTLFALGVGDRIVAKTRGESPPSPRLRERLESLPSLGARSPNTEALVAAGPDLLITDQSQKVSGSQGSPSIAELEGLGIATYVVGGGCAEGFAEDSTGLGSLFADLRQLGAIFAVPDRAEALADRLRTRLGEVRQRTAGEPRPGVVELSQVAGQLYVTAGGLASDVLARAGGANLFAGLSGQFAAVSAEQVVARDPEAIVVDEFTGSAAGRDEAIAFVTETFPTVEAVEQGRVLVIDAAKTGARGSTRPVDGVLEIARFLHPTASPPGSVGDG